VTLGDLIVDVVASASGPLAQGSDRAGRIAFRQGGSAANTARWVAAAGGEAIFIGAVGKDPWARRLGTSLAVAGVATHLVAKRAPTARIVVLVEPDGERTFVTDRGAADLLEPSDLRTRWFGRAAALHLPAYSLFNDPLASAARRAAELARVVGAVVSVDLASRQPILDLGSDEARRRVATVAPDLLFGNPSEASAILDGGPERDLLALSPIVVVKRGAAGSRILARSRAADGSFAPVDIDPATIVDVPSSAIVARDTTGAGDAFAAGFLVHWLALEPLARHDPKALSASATRGHRTASRLLRAAHRTDALD
jgi:sugar/nucleoside kinase (ribokinase family)